MTNSQDNITMRNDRSQIVEYNNPFFECFSANVYFASTRNHFVTEHWHEDIEYLYVVDGEIEYFVNGNSMILAAGTGIMVNSKRIHSNRSVLGKNCAFYCAILHPCLLSPTKYVEQNFVAPILGPGSPDYIYLNQNDWTKDIIDIMIRLFDTNYTKSLELEILSSSYSILRCLYEHIDFQPVHEQVISANLSTFKAMMIFVQDHYSEKISLEEIAAAGNVGKTLCAKLFKKYVAKTPGEYLIHYRIQKSIELLTKTAMSTTEIGYATGFSSGSHYTKTFREIMHCTPLQYRHDSESQGTTYIY